MRAHRFLAASFPLGAFAFRRIEALHRHLLLLVLDCHEMQDEESSPTSYLQAALTVEGFLKRILQLVALVLPLPQRVLCKISTLSSSDSKQTQRLACPVLVVLLLHNNLLLLELRVLLLELLLVRQHVLLKGAAHSMSTTSRRQVSASTYRLRISSSQCAFSDDCRAVRVSCKRCTRTNCKHEDEKAEWTCCALDKSLFSRWF